MLSWQLIQTYVCVHVCVCVMFIYMCVCIYALAYEASKEKEDSIRNEASGYLCAILAKNLAAFYP